MQRSNPQSHKIGTGTALIQLLPGTGTFNQLGHWHLHVNLSTGTCACAGRRTVAMAEGVRMRQEAAAYHAAHIRGRGRWGSARGPGH